MSPAYDDEALERLYELLADALEQARPASFDAPVTVAEIYQELVPYRAVRAEVGFGMNAEYEHALLRLLSGEAGLVRLEPDQARDEILRELRTLSPNVSIYREYAGCDVWVRPRRDARRSRAAPTQVAEATTSVAPAPRSPRAVRAEGTSPERDAVEMNRQQGHEGKAGEGPVPTPAPATAGSPSAAGRGSATHARPGEPVDGPGTAAHASVPAPQPLASREASAQPDGAVDETVVLAGARRCGYCDSELPAHRVVRFCPWCGGDQATRPCPRCGEPIEPGWAYCVACGGAGAEEGGPAHGRA
jgi:hypothetical protein